jgi:hypothetical protein
MNGRRIFPRISGIRTMSSRIGLRIKLVCWILSLSTIPRSCHLHLSLSLASVLSRTKPSCTALFYSRLCAISLGAHSSSVALHISSTLRAATRGSDNSKRTRRKSNPRDSLLPRLLGNAAISTSRLRKTKRVCRKGADSNLTARLRWERIWARALDRKRDGDHDVLFFSILSTFLFNVTGIL